MIKHGNTSSQKSSVNPPPKKNKQKKLLNLPGSLKYCKTFEITLANEIYHCTFLIHILLKAYIL